MEKTEKELKAIIEISNEMGLTEEQAEQELRDQQKSGGRIIIIGVGFIAFIIYLLFY